MRGMPKRAASSDDPAADDAPRSTSPTTGMSPMIGSSPKRWLGARDSARARRAAWVTRRMRRLGGVEALRAAGADDLAGERHLRIAPSLRAIVHASHDRHGRMSMSSS